MSGLLVILLLIAFQAVITLTYAALNNARTTPLRERAEHGERPAKRLLALIASTNMTITYYTMSTLIRFAIAAVAVATLSEPLSQQSPLTEVLADALALFAIALVVIVLGDTVPEAIGSTYADNLVFGAGAWMNFWMRFFSPVILLLVRVSKILSSLAKSGDLVNTVTEEEIMTLIDAGHTGGTIEEEEKDMIFSVLQLDETYVSEMMIPRIDITAIELDASLTEAANVFVQSGFSRVPVYEGNLDNIKGLLYAKDLLTKWEIGKNEASVESLMRSCYFVPETKHADELLKELQKRRVHLAIVVDEYGGTAGLVTIEDIIEEIIGDIQDEYDLNEEDEYEEISEYEYIVDAGIDLDDFNDLLDVDLPTEDSDTLGGYIYTYFGRVPIAEEIIEDDTLYLRVMSVDGRRIRKVFARRKHALDAENREDSIDTGKDTTPDDNVRVKRESPE